jgi:acyl-coenzyme A thioesterase PaaI-like protein
MDALRREQKKITGADLQKLVDGIPYAVFIGMQIDLKGNEVTTIMPFAPHLIGNPHLPALHGGVIGGFLEMTAILQLALELGGTTLPKPITVSVDYRRSGRPVDTYARATITRLGRRVANVQAEAWQENRVRPITTCQAHFLLAGD